MQSENKQKDQKNEESKLMENGDLVIAPLGGDGKEPESAQASDLTVAPEVQQEPAFSQPAPKSAPVIDAAVNAEKPKIASKKRKRKSLFDLRLKDYKDKKEYKPVIKGETRKHSLFVFKSFAQWSTFGMIAKNTAFAVIALVIFAGTFAFDNVLFAAEDNFVEKYTALNMPAGQSVTIINDDAKSLVSNGYLLNEGDQILTDEYDKIEIELADEGVLRLGAGTILTFDEMDSASNKYRLKLDEGLVWGNTQYSDSDTQIYTDTTLVIPGASSFNVGYNGSSVEVYADTHDVYVGIRNEGELINGFWLAQGNRSIMSDNKITQKAKTIEKLLYSKLIKEFNYGRLSAQKIKDDPWISAQRQNDSFYFKNIQFALFEGLRMEGLKTLNADSFSFKTKALLTDIQTVLTFSESKKIESLLDAMFVNFNDSKYLYFQGELVDADLRLSLFVNDINDPKYFENTFFHESHFKRLNSELSSLLLVIPGDDLYPVKKELYNQLLGNNMKSFVDQDLAFNLLTYHVNDIYDSIDENALEAVTTFTEYKRSYKTIFNRYKNKIDEIEEQLKHQNILVDNILFSYPELYKVEIFETKKTMEENYLLALDSSTDKKEQRQTYINSKIDLLTRIRYFLFNERLEVDDARQIVFFLIRDIEDLQKDTLELVAVNELFEIRLHDIGLLWEYLKTPEYSTTQLHGASHEERFDAFKAIQERDISYQDIREDILGTAEKAELTPESVLDQAEQDLKDNEIVKVEFGFYEDVNQPKIPILSAEVGGIGFRATYDWDRKLLSSIIANDKLISAEGVKLENAKSFIYQSVSSRTQIVERPTETSTELSVEDDPLADVKNAAKVFLVQKLKQLNIVLTKESVKIVDFNNGIYQIENVYFSENKSAVFTFTYKNVGNKVTYLVVQTLDGEKEFDNEFDLSLLSKVVLKVYEDSRL